MTNFEIGIFIKKIFKVKKLNKNKNQLYIFLMGNQNVDLYTPEVKNQNNFNNNHQTQNSNIYSQNYQNNINKALSNPPIINQSQNQNQNFNPQNNFNIKQPNNNQNNQFLRSSTFNQRNIYKYHLTIKSLKDCFQNYSINNEYLNKDRFNDAIESLFRFPIPEMHYTYLSEKIFNLIDDSGDGKIQEDEFIKGFSNVLKDKNFRLHLSMVSMMNSYDKNRSYIEGNEIKEFFIKSFIYGYKHLLWQIQKDKNNFQKKNLPIVSMTQIELWAERFDTQIKSYIDNDLRESGIDPYSPIDFETFKKWIYKDHVIRLNYGGKSCEIATSLTKLDDIGFDEKSPYI